MVLRRNVLIFHAGALGDFVLSWPLALAAGRLFPQSRIYYITHGQKGKLAERALNVESADIEAGWHHLHSDPSALPERATRLLAGAHHVFSFVHAPGSSAEANCRALTPHAHCAFLHPAPPSDWTTHATDYLMEQLGGMPAVATAVEQMAGSILQRGVGLQAPAGGSRPVLIHPGAGSREKCWPVDSYALLATKLLNAGRAVRLILGEVELERMSDDDLNRFDPKVEVRRPQTYEQLTAELLGGAALVTNDTGPGHLAGVLGVGVLSLFGPTDPAVWKPLGPRARFLRHLPLVELDVDAVYGALAELL